MSNYWGFVCRTCDDYDATSDRINHGEDTLIAMARVASVLLSSPDLDRIDLQVDNRWVPIAWLRAHAGHDLAIEGSYGGNIIAIPAPEDTMNATTRLQKITEARRRFDAAEKKIDRAATVPDYVRDLVAAVGLLVDVATADTPTIGRALTAAQQQQVEGGH